MPASSRAPKPLEPMYASVSHEIPQGRAWSFEPKYDGVRVLAHVTQSAARLITRNGNDKAKQFPEIVAALIRLARAAQCTFIMDGEIVALVKNAPARFQTLQGRMHLKNSAEILTQMREMPAALMAFDLLRTNRKWLLEELWIVRRRALQALLSDSREALGADASVVRRHVRLAPSMRARGNQMVERARKEGWEGIIAKRVSDYYQPGERVDYWLKLKIEYRQEFVVGGYTEPRNSRKDIGALLLGYFDHRGRLVYVGHTGGGFTREGLAEMRALLDQHPRLTSPFLVTPRTNEAATWVKPVVVVEVKFSEWTEDGRLRQPIFLGVRDDKPARQVTREASSIQGTPALARGKL